MSSLLSGFFFFWLQCVACRDLSSPEPGVELVPPAVEARSPNHWTAREFPVWLISLSISLQGSDSSLLLLSSIPLNVYPTNLLIVLLMEFG